MANPYRHIKQSPLNQKGNKKGNKKGLNAFERYIDINDDGEAKAWEYAVEGLTWLPTLIATAGTAPSGPGAIATGTATKVGARAFAKRVVNKYVPAMANRLKKWAHGKNIPGVNLPRYITWPAVAQSGKYISNKAFGAQDDFEKKYNIKNNDIKTQTENAKQYNPFKIN